MATRRLVHKRESGFSLIEVLIALMIMAVGLLGLAALQTISVSQGGTSRLRGTAVALGHSYMDRIVAEGSIIAAERTTYGTVATTGYTFFGSDLTSLTDNTYPVQALTTVATKYTVLGLIYSTDPAVCDPYYIANPTAPNTDVFTVSWYRDPGIINQLGRSAVSQFVVNIAWNETNAAGTVTPKYISMSRYVRF